MDPGDGPPPPEPPPPPIGPPAPGVAPPTVPAAPSAGAPPADPDAPRRRWKPVLAGVAVAVIAVTAVAVVSLDESNSGWPDEVAGLAQVDTAETRAFEEGFGEIEFGDLEITFGFYGRAEQVELMLARYANLPPGAPLEGLLQGAGGGIIGSGGSADIDAASVTEHDGIAYHCMPFQGKLFVTDPTEADGRVCVWYEDADAILLMDATTNDLDTAIDHAASAHVALGG